MTPVSDNVRCNLGMAARFRELGIPAFLLDFDLTKAYDSVDRSWLSTVAARLGFEATGVVRWFWILMAGSERFLCPAVSFCSLVCLISCCNWLRPLKKKKKKLASASTERITGLALNPMDFSFSTSYIVLHTSSPSQEFPILCNVLLTE